MILKERFCFFDGQLLPFEKAALQLNDLGVLRGYAIFDYFKTCNKIPFHSKHHLARFENSAKGIGLDLLYSQEQIEEIIDELIFLDNKKEECAFRLVLTGGYSENGLYVTNPIFFILSESVPIVPDWHFTKGIKVLLYPYQREIPTIKTTNYLPILLMNQKMQAENAIDLLYHQQDQISECTRSNFFLFQGDTLFTPNTGILNGITRQVVIHLASAHYAIQEQSISIGALASATEAFRTGTTSNITPITQINDRPVGDGKVGKNTQKLMDLLKAYQKNYPLEGGL